MAPRNRQKLQPRSIDAIINSARTAQMDKQRRWEGAGGEGPYPVWNQPNPQERRHSLDDISPGWLDARAPINNQSGIMLALANNPTVNRIQSIYNQVDPFLPEVDFGDQRVGYDINRNLWGGNLNIGGEYDFDDEGYNLGINWGKTW